MGWKMTIFEALRRGATMSHEPWPNCLFPIDRVSASRRASKVRSSISWRSLLEELFLLGSVSRHWEQTQDLGISALGTRGLHRTEREPKYPDLAFAPSGEKL